MRFIEGIVKISVRELVEFVLRQGSINHTTFISNNRAVIGTKAHKKIQQNMDENYEAEVKLVHEIEKDGIIYIVEGRADGIIKNLVSVIIDEIKTTATSLELIDENYNYLHWAQAKCYAYFYAKQNNLKEIQVRLTYYHIETKEIKYLNRSFFFEELEHFFNVLIEKYSRWINFYRNWIEVRDSSLKKIAFPFKVYRKGQRELAVEVYRSIQREENLYINAPTGIGKTISTLFPTLKAMGEGYCDKIFYLTAKTITRTVAEQAVRKLYNEGMRLKVVTLTAKDKICFMEERMCHPDFCKWADGHFDRVDEAVYTIINEEDFFTREVIEKYARIYKLCPFELALDLATWADVIIADYNYMFDPVVCLKRFLDHKDFVVLVDEAHNLADRAKEMYSASFSKKKILTVKRELGKEYKGITKEINKLNEWLRGIKKDYIDCIGSYISREAPKTFYILLRQFIGACDKKMHGQKTANLPASLLELYFDAYAFIRTYEFFDEHYRTYAEAFGFEIKLKMYCLDPSELLQRVVSSCKSVIFFSATLMPIVYYKYMLGGEDERAINFASPFPREHSLKLLATDVSTRYMNREKSYSRITEYIKEVAKAKVGHYMVFFPSYKYMQETYEYFIGLGLEEFKVNIQMQDMTESEKEGFLANFEEKALHSTINFCVLGGAFSEGIDLTGERLIGTIIVGVGLPPLSIEKELTKEYFDELGKSGYHYAYTYPGINKVLQGVGRLIRTKEDKGVILLIDDRYQTSLYRSLLTEDFEMSEYITQSQIAQKLKHFWKRYSLVSK